MDCAARVANLSSGVKLSLWLLVLKPFDWRDDESVKVSKHGAYTKPRPTRQYHTYVKINLLSGIPSMSFYFRRVLKCRIG